MSTAVDSPGRYLYVCPICGASIELGYRLVDKPGKPAVLHCGNCENVWAVNETLDPAVGGAKYDGDKARWDLLPLEVLEPVVRVLTFGAKKYAPNNWKKVPGWRWRYFSAAMRHFAAYKRGEWLDPETGEPHLAHMLCCSIFLFAQEVEAQGNPDVDQLGDRDG